MLNTSVNTFNNSFLNKSEFSDHVEKLNEKTLTWSKKWIVIESRHMFIFDRRPVNESEMAKPQEMFVFTTASCRNYREFKHKSLQNKKNYVCLVYINTNCSGCLSLTLGFKNEKTMNKFSEVITGGAYSASAGNENLPLQMNQNVSKTPIKLEGYREREGMNISSNKNSSSKKEKSDYSTLNINPANHSIYNSFRQDFLKFSNKEKVENMCYKMKGKHQKNKSCGDYELIQSVDNVNLSRLKEGKSIGGHNKSFSKGGEKRLITEMRENSGTSNKQFKESIQENSTKLSNHNHNRSKIRSVQPAATGFTSLINNQNEENSSLSKMINKMLQSSKKSITNRSLLSSNQSYEDLENVTYRINQSSNKQTQNISYNTRNKQLSKIIKLSLPNAEKLTSSNALVNSPNANRIDYEKYNKYNEEVSNYEDQSESKVNKGKFKFNLSQDDMSFDEKEDKEQTPLANSTPSNVHLLVKKLEAFDEYFFDTSVFKKMCKSYGVSKFSIGSLYKLSSKDFVKNQLLVEMIAILSKKFLKESILKSLEVVLKEKDMNKHYFIQPTHQHSIEYSIVDIFNSFLGNNPESEELYHKLLPGYLVEHFKVDYLLKIKNIVSIQSLFVTMQNRNKVIFNDNIDVNFQDKAPFVVQDIKYISPYYVNKWYSLAIGNNLNSFNTLGTLTTPNEVEGTTNIKRMKYNNFEMRDSFEKMLRQMRSFERDSEELRLSLVKNIYFHIFNKRNELGLKLCDYYVQKFADTISLNPIIYLVLSEIYNETLGIDLARLFYEKGVNILNWLSPRKDNPLLIDLNYTFSLLLMKQIVSEEDSNSGSNLTNTNSDYYREIEDLLESSLDLCDKFFDSPSEKKVKIVLQLSLIRLSRLDHHLQYTPGFNISSLLDQTFKSLDFLDSKKLYKEEIIYLNLFIDIARLISGGNIENEMKVDFLKRLHEAKKKMKGEGGVNLRKQG